MPAGLCPFPIAFVCRMHAAAALTPPASDSTSCLQARQKLFSSRSGKAGNASASRLPVSAVSAAAAPKASRALQPADAPPLSNLSMNGAASVDSGMHSGGMEPVQLSRLPASLIRPMLGGSPVRAGGSQVKAERATWKSQASVGPPPDLKWSPTVERLIMNSTKQVWSCVACINRCASPSYAAGRRVPDQS